VEGARTKHIQEREGAYRGQWCAEDVRVCREEVRRSGMFAKGYEDCREKRDEKSLRSDESGQGRPLSSLLCPPHQSIVGCQVEARKGAIDVRGPSEDQTKAYLSSMGMQGRQEDMDTQVARRE
jgi:hypothetical protein